MNAAEIFSAVRQVGATLQVRGDSLVASNASRIAPAIKAAIREHKPELIAALAKPVCAVCRAPDNLWHFGDALVHEQCARFLPKPEAAEPTVAYRATSVGPDGLGCRVEIVELPQAQRYRRTFAHLQLKPPALVPLERWRQCLKDGSRFLAKWGEQAEALGWTSADLFGLAPVPAKPHPSFSRLSRYDLTGLLWLLQSREVVAVTEATATIKNPLTGNVTIYRKHNKLALGPLGDSQAPSTSGTRFQKTEMPTLDALDARCACNSAGPAACRFPTPRQTS